MAISHCSLENFPATRSYHSSFIHWVKFNNTSSLPRRNRLRIQMKHSKPIRHNRNFILPFDLTDDSAVFELSLLIFKIVSLLLIIHRFAVCCHLGSAMLCSNCAFVAGCGETLREMVSK